MVQWIKPNINIDWIGSRKSFFVISSIAILASIAALVFNGFVRGDVLNYGTDFKGGSEIQIEFSKHVEVAQVRDALTKSGLGGAEVVRMEDSNRPHFFMLRLAEVTAFTPEDQEQVKQSLEKTFEKNLVNFDYKTGGDKLYLRFKRDFEVDEQAIEKAFSAGKIEVQQVQRFGRIENNVYEVALAGLDRDIRNIFDSALGEGSVKDVPQVEAVGAKMGKQLRDAGIKSVVYSLLLIMLYVALRFDFRYAPGGVVALAHDVLITTGLFAVLWQEFSMTVVAALLTLAGYSINDTIVVFDRIRENVARYRDRKFPQVVNASINETLGRTVMTSLTTLLTSLSLWFLGTGVIKLFAFTFTFGIIIGTYSSIAVACPVVIYLNDKLAKKSAR